MFFQDLPINKGMLLDDCQPEHEKFQPRNMQTPVEWHSVLAFDFSDPAVAAGFAGYRTNRYRIRKLSRARDPTKYKLGKLLARKPETHLSKTVTACAAYFHAVAELLFRIV